MSLKTKIISILFAASIATAVMSSGMLVFLLKLLGDTSFSGSEMSVAVVFSVVIYFLSGLTLLVLLNILLGKNVIIPAVERKMLENERSMLTEQLQHSQKMEAVGRLAGSIAHDFNNLLTIIDGYASLIVATPKGGETESSAQEIIDAARRAASITRKLLSFSHKEKAELVSVDLNTILTDTDKMLNRLIGEKVTLITKPSDESIHVLADAVQIGQVLMNLVVNARDAMPNGGRISIGIGCRPIEDGECGKPDAHSPGNYAEISVQDTGQGIDEETIGHIFETFFTTKPQGKGTGLGLTIVKSIVKQHNGFLNVNSKIGNGTTFMVYLPVIEQESTAGEEEHEEEPVVLPEDNSVSETSSAPAHTGATILIVEDDPMIRSLVARTLEKQQYSVLTAEEGWAGVKIVRNHKERIDLLFTDVVMPGMGGAELALAAQEFHPDIKVLFMSGYSRTQLNEEGVPPDANLLEKPFTPEKLLITVRKILAS